ncbi:MAG: inositol monophosphatase [Candidatus Cloacimonetes bacterium]|jgi:myo-inositol-1(or 4)-monophosphatase|nr:inositol monophosphatase [Candidatus Cloacimonadota bacterium]
MAESLLAVAREAAEAAAAVHRRYAGSVSTESWSEKGAADFVTHVDHEAEAAVVSVIRSHYPGHAILAEEAATDDSAALARQAEHLWIVDPLDGTTNFLHGYPMYAVSIAFVERGRLSAGVVHGTATHDRWYATAGGGAFHNDRRIWVSEIESLSHALIGTGFPFKVLERMDEYTTQFRQVLAHTAGIRRAGSAALDLCHLATGWFDGFWELSLAPWDFAAGALIAREAGAVVTSLDGELDVTRGGSVVGGNPVIHRELLALLHASTEPVHG